MRQAGRAGVETHGAVLAGGLGHMRIPMDQNADAGAHGLPKFGRRIDVEHHPVVDDDDPHAFQAAERGTALPGCP